MTPRREAILEAIIREYVQTAVPVGSLTLVRNYSFPFSPATIRAEMAELEDEGYIAQPHTSAGRVPTQKGYRYFVDLIKKEEAEIARREEMILRKRLAAMHSRFERMLDAATQTLSEMTGNVALSSIGNNEISSHGLANLFRQPEFDRAENVLKVAELIDNLPVLLRELPRSKDFMVLIGNESPIGKTSGCSLVISRFQTPFDFNGYIGVLGPTRMPYQRVISLVLKTKDFLEEEA